MINTLRKLGVEPQGIEQPLDLSIPENKMMLAFYLAAPEVENDRRALNVFNGMRRARKEGRYLEPAPLGYINKVNENGRKCIALKEDEANILKWAFEELASGILNTEQIWKLAKLKRLKKASKNNFWFAIRNPLYCGKIFIPKYKDEESRFVKGQHEPLISEALYYDVPDILNGRKKTQRTKLEADEMLPLRGFLICPKCRRMLTGSASKGSKQKYYHYYHCISSCGVRYRANMLNSSIIDEIKKYVQPLPHLQLYTEIVANTFKSKTHLQREEVKNIKLQIEEANNRLIRARDLLISGSLDPDDYRVIKSESEEKMHRLEIKLTTSINEKIDIDSLLNKSICNISQLDILYSNASIKQKRKIISSRFPEKLTFDGFQYRTNRINEAINLMNLIDIQLGDKKMGQE